MRKHLDIKATGGKKLQDIRKRSVTLQKSRSFGFF